MRLKERLAVLDILTENVIFARPVSRTETEDEPTFRQGGDGQRGLGDMERMPQRQHDRARRQRYLGCGCGQRSEEDPRIGMPDRIGIAFAVKGDIPHPQRIETQFIGLGCDAELSIELYVGGSSRLRRQNYAE